jgi:uncharacterized protein (TIGR03437 family)
VSNRRALTILILLCGGESLLADRKQPPASSQLLENAAGENSAFAAIGRLKAALTCTGTLIDPSGLGAPDAKAWLLSAGHCISLDAYGVILNQPSTAQVQFNYFVDTANSGITVKARTIAWSTMKGVDVSLIELNATLGDLRAQGLVPFHLASRRPGAGQSVFWTGIPLSPIPPELQFLRLGRCTLGRPVPLIEGSWIWNADLSNDCPDLYAGASGSPLFDADSNEVIGVIGTGTLLNFEQGPDYNCQVNRPCVTRAGGPVMQTNTSYASPVQGIGQCFDQSNVLDVKRAGCPLDPGYQLTIQSGPNEVQPEVNGSPAMWNAALSGSQHYYAYKHFPIGEDDCSSFSGYTAPIPVATAPVISDRLGSKDGYYLLCIIAGDTPSFDSSWQRPTHASMRFKKLDSQPPVVPIDYVVVPLLNAYQLTNLTGGEGTSDLGFTQAKSGPLSTTDCSDPQNYRALTSIPTVVRNSDMPVRVCWKIADKAGNYTDPIAFEFGAPALLPNTTRNAASNQRGPVAKGSVFQADTFNLTDRSESSTAPQDMLAGVTMFLVDGAGRIRSIPMTAAGPLYVEGVMPGDAAPGRSTLFVQPPRGPALSQSITIEQSSPGLYSVSGSPAGFARDSQGNMFPIVMCPQPPQCQATHLPLSSTPGGLDFVVYATGMRGALGPVRMHIGTYTVGRVKVTPRDDAAGIDAVTFHLPHDFPLRLLQAVAAETADGVSNYLFIYLE